ncbi:tellurite methyltransferase, partial [Proteus mirabilis]|nr:tellurite methyltransferase [Proteus mirabilis]
WDWNGGSLANLQHIADAEGLKDVYLAEVDLNQVESLEFDGPYQFILSTVVLMFLHPAVIAPLMTRMQQETAAGGYNL